MCGGEVTTLLWFHRASLAKINVTGESQVNACFSYRQCRLAELCQYRFGREATALDPDHPTMGRQKTNYSSFLFNSASQCITDRLPKKSQRGDKNLKSFTPLHLPENGDEKCARNKHRVFCNFRSICQLAFHSCPHDSPGKLVKPSKHRGLVSRTNMLRAKDEQSTPTFPWLTGALANHSPLLETHAPVCRGCYVFLTTRPSKANECNFSFIKVSLIALVTYRQ